MTHHRFAREPPPDDEGVPAAHPSANGVKVSLRSTNSGAGRQAKHRQRSRGAAVYPPSASAFVVAPGNTTFDAMIKDIKEGLVIEQLMGAEQGNLLGGDFSGNVLLGYKIENGAIVGRVKDTMVSGNVYKILKDITAIGSEAKWVGGFLNTPPLYCKGLSVSSKE
jgi:PmbA protein